MGYLISFDTVKPVRSLDPIFMLTDLRNLTMTVMLNIVPKSTLDSPSSPIKDDNTDADSCPIKEILNRKKYRTRKKCF